MSRKLSVPSDELLHVKTLLAGQSLPSSMLSNQNAATVEAPPTIVQASNLLASQSASAVSEGTPTIIQASSLPKGTVFYQRIATPHGMCPV